MNIPILFVHDPKNEPGKAFVQTLQKTIRGPEITLKEAGMTTLFLDVKKYSLVHFFLSASSKFASLVKKTKGKSKTIQTILSIPEKPEDYPGLVFADHAIVFSNQEKAEMEKYMPGTSVDSILPCLELPPVSERKSTMQVRAELSPGNQMLIVAFGELTNQKDFTSLLYILREYQRRGVFRVLLLLINETAETKTWKERLTYSIDKEKLTAVSFLNESFDVFSLIDSSDLVLYLSRTRNAHFSFPVKVLQALSLGKPLLCYNVLPVSEALRGFQPAWVCQNTEDVIRVSVDIQKQAAHLEQISTEVAQYARSRLSPESVSSQYQEIYNRLLKA